MREAGRSRHVRADITRSPGLMNMQSRCGN